MPMTFSKRIGTYAVGAAVCLFLLATPGSGLEEGEAREIVHQLYQLHLKRIPDDGGMETALRHLVDEGKSESWLAKTLRGSEEGQRVRGQRQQRRIAAAALAVCPLPFFALLFWLKRRCRWPPGTIAWASGLVYLTWVLVFVETAARTYLAFAAGGTLWNPERAIAHTFLRDYAASEDTLSRGAPQWKKDIDLLVLGGSVMVPGFGDVPGRIADELAARGMTNVVVHNASLAGHTSRDSRFKYETLLADREFDIVFIYHGINEVRANNCPTDIYRDDYGHYAWYAYMGAAERCLDSIQITAIPYAFEIARIKYRQAGGQETFVPIGQPRDAWLAEGATVKTERAFRANISAIADHALARGARVIMASFAHYLPGNYNRDAFWSGTLDYAPGGYSVDLWGLPETVMAGLAVHNRVLREIAEARPEVTFVDMDACIPKEGKQFQDICHLSHAHGAPQFARHLVDALALPAGQDVDCTLNAAADRAGREVTTPSFVKHGD